MKTPEARAFLATTPSIQTQLRVGMSGIVGLDVPACLALMVASGVDQKLAGLWLPFWERGILAALEKKKSENE